MNKRAPRNIRDIAHLYISQSKRAGVRGHRRVVVAGVNRECFPGFHTANLAAALAVNGYRVRLVELSGLLPNAARFLAMPPRVYTRALARDGTGLSVSALNGVDLWFALPPPSDAVDLIHVPPIDSGAEFAAARHEVQGEDCTWLFIAATATEVPRGRRGVARARVLVVGTDAPRRKGGPVVAGQVTRWRHALAEVLPAVVRDPRSLMSRSYIECGARLIDDGSAYGRFTARAARVGPVAR
jgi:hypothetical protein